MCLPAASSDKSHVHKTLNWRELKAGPNTGVNETLKFPLYIPVELTILLFCLHFQI